MGTFLGLLFGAVGTTIGAASKAKQLSEQRADKIQSLERQQTQLTDSYNQSIAANATNVENAKADLKAANKALENDIGTSTENQKTSLGQNAGSMQQQDSIANQELAALTVDTHQAEGAAVQKAGLSGFRLSGSGSNVITEQQNTNKETLDKANAQATLNRYNSYNSARNNYVAYNQQIQSYKDQQTENTRKTDQTLAALQQERNNLDTNYKRDTGYLADDYKDVTSQDYTNAMNWAIAGSWLSGLTGTAVNAAARL